MQVLNSSVARPWKLEQNTSGQASRQALRASRPWKLEQNNMTKKRPFFGPQNVRKSRRAKMGLPSSRFQPQLLLVKSASTWNKRLNRFATLKGPKRDQNWTLQGGPLLISSGPLSDLFLKHVSFARGSKNGPSAGWIRCLLEGPVLSPPMHLLQLRCSNVETHQRHTNQHRVGNKGLEQGRPQLRLQKSYQFQVQKTNPKTSLLYLLVLIMTIFPFLLCWCKPAIEALRGSPRPERSQARPGEAWARPRHGRKRIGTRTKRGSWGLETT